MPKLKTKRAAAKRFRKRAGGGLKRSQAYLRHILTKKNTKRKRHLRGTGAIGAEIPHAGSPLLTYFMNSSTM